MAHFAQIDENNIVVQVITAPDEYETTGEKLYAELLGGTWKRTSYNTFEGQHRLGNTPFRINYAGIDDFYDEKLDGFIKSSPYQSWVLNQEKGIYEAPIPLPSNNKNYSWDENSVSWVEY